MCVCCVGGRTNQPVAYRARSVCVALPCRPHRHAHPPQHARHLAISHQPTTKPTNRPTNSRLRRELREREAKHSKLVREVCDVRYSIGRAGDPHPERVDVREQLRSTQRAHLALIKLVDDALRSSSSSGGSES